MSSLFNADGWRLHPDWMYCQYKYAGTEAHEFATKEAEMSHFLARMQRRDWHWGDPTVRPLPKCNNKGAVDPNCPKCERECL